MTFNYRPATNAAAPKSLPVQVRDFLANADICKPDATLQLAAQQLRALAPAKATESFIKFFGLDENASAYNVALQVNASISALHLENGDGSTELGEVLRESLLKFSQSSYEKRVKKYYERLAELLEQAVSTSLHNKEAATPLETDKAVLPGVKVCQQLQEALEKPEDFQQVAAFLEALEQIRSTSSTKNELLAQHKETLLSHFEALFRIPLVHKNADTFDRTYYILRSFYRLAPQTIEPLFEKLIQATADVEMIDRLGTRLQRTFSLYENLFQDGLSNLAEKALAQAVQMILPQAQDITETSVRDTIHSISTELYRTRQGARSFRIAELVLAVYRTASTDLSGEDNGRLLGVVISLLYKDSPGEINKLFEQLMEWSAPTELEIRSIIYPVMVFALRKRLEDAAGISTDANEEVNVKLGLLTEKIGQIEQLRGHGIQ